LGCGQHFPSVVGIPDLRLHSDRYLSLASDRAKAQVLAELEATSDLAALAQAYYAITDDVDSVRQAAYRAHLERACERGRAVLRQVPKSGRILEVGCGSGGFLVAAAHAGCAIEGVDIALRWLALARRRLADHGLNAPLIAASAESLPWPDGSFDTVVADSVLEHLERPYEAIKEWARVLRPGGRLVVWSPNRFSILLDPHVRLWAIGWLPPRLAAAWVRFRRRGRWTVRPLSARHARRLAEQAGFNAIAVEAPRIPPEMVNARHTIARQALALYEKALGLPVTRDLLRWFGPLWQLTARRRLEA
jgi:ubiquinone/menaquinone biosynthesis C-methylase UbiE